jgi:hypothetical protein
MNAKRIRNILAVDFEDWSRRGAKNVLRVGTLLVLTAFLSGCMILIPMPQRPPWATRLEENIELIRPGETTREEVRKSLGTEPQFGFEGAYDNGRFWVYTWRLDYVFLLHDNPRWDAFAIEFGPDDRVLNVQVFRSATVGEEQAWMNAQRNKSP